MGRSLIFAATFPKAGKYGKFGDQRIIMDVGGDWCSYCREMDQFFQEHSDLAQLRDDNFVTVAVFFSSENKNEKVLSHYPKVEGIPYFFVLGKDGTLLHAQGLEELETGGEPNPEKMKDFLLKWSPAHTESTAKAN